MLTGLSEGTNRDKLITNVVLTAYMAGWRYLMVPVGPRTGQSEAPGVGVAAEASSKCPVQHKERKMETERSSSQLEEFMTTRPTATSEKQPEDCIQN